MNKFETEVLSPNVLAVRFKQCKAGWEQWVLLSSDRHHDNKHCNRKLELEHLKLAKERNALICDFGDLFCAMQGKYDPRSSMNDIRPEDVCQNYLDSIVKHAAEDYAPYAKNFLIIGQGNHEKNISKRHHTNLISSLTLLLNIKHGGHIINGAFGGWVLFRFTLNGTQRTTRKLYYHHGAGGGGPVTKGVIQTNRQAVYLPDADIVVNGHTHDSWVLPLSRLRCSQAGKTSRDLLWFARTPGYKDGYGDGSEGWEVETWKPPKPIGAIWMRFYVKAGKIITELFQDVR